MAWREMRTLLGALLLLPPLLAIPATAPAADELRFLTWADYISPEVIAKFERESGHHITIVPVDSGDKLLDGLRDNKPGDLDLGNPLDHHMPPLIKEGKLERIDADTLAHYSAIDEPWRRPPYDRNNSYSVPLHWGTTSFVVDTALYKGDIDRYRLLFDPPPELKGRVSFLIGAPEVIRMALMYLGLPSCTTDAGEVQKALDLIRASVNPKLVTTIEDNIERFSGSEIGAGVVWNGDALRARAAKPSLRYAYPKEGVLVWADALVVPKGAPHKAAALAFLDFMLRPENAALQTNYNHYANSIRDSDALLTPEIAEAPEVIVRSSAKILYLSYCGSDVYNRYERAYNDVLGRKAP